MQAINSKVGDLSPGLVLLTSNLHKRAKPNWVVWSYLRGCASLMPRMGYCCLGDDGLCPYCGPKQDSVPGNHPWSIPSSVDHQEWF